MAVKSISELRENAMIYLYQMLIKASANMEEILGDEELLSEEFSSTIDFVLSDIRKFRETIADNLIDWEFERLGYIEQAILLLAIGEKNALSTPKSIIIDEAIKLAKKYGDDDTYKLINAALDKVIQWH